jgi:mono/diheme cytochrome c family protein
MWAAMQKMVRGCMASFSMLAVCAMGGHVLAQNADQGKRIFTERAEPPCGVCHTLKAAESTGELGPNLDELKPNLDKVRTAVKNGVGVMPSFSETLSDAEIEAVSEFVARAVGASK